MQRVSGGRTRERRRGWWATRPDGQIATGGPGRASSAAAKAGVWQTAAAEAEATEAAAVAEVARAAAGRTRGELLLCFAEESKHIVALAKALLPPPILKLRHLCGIVGELERLAWVVVCAPQARARAHGE